MKKFLNLLALSSLLFFVVSGCKKDNTQPSSSSSMTATLDGSNWTATTTSVYIINGMISITGNNAAQQTITITINSSDTGIYVLNQSSFSALAYVPDQSGSISYTSNGSASAVGSVHVTAINTKDSTISGTFYSTVYKPLDGTSKTITAGKFTNLKFKSKLSTVNAKNYFNVTIDGVAWTPASITGSLMSGKILVNATSSDGSKTVGLWILNTTTPGSYDLLMFGDYMGQYNTSMTISMVSMSGTVTITKNDKLAQWIEGTFSFSASQFMGSNSANLTNGSFGVTY